MNDNANQTMWEMIKSYPKWGWALLVLGLFLGLFYSFVVMPRKVDQMEKLYREPPHPPVVVVE